MKIEATDVDDYLANVQPDRRDDVSWVMGLVAKHGGKELTSSLEWGMPTYKLGDAVVLSFAQQKNYISVYADVDTVERYREALGKLRVGKSCVRFTNRSKIDEAVLGAIIGESVTAARTRPGPLGSSAGDAPAKKAPAKKAPAKKAPAKKSSPPKK